MPVSLTRKVEALRQEFGSATRLANALGVSRSQLRRWTKGAALSPVNASKVERLERVWSSLRRLYDREAAVAWLFGINPLLGDRRPIDTFQAGRAEELLRVISAEYADTYA